MEPGRRASFLVVGVIVSVLAVMGGGRVGADVEGLTFSATVDGRPLDDADANDALRLDPDVEPVVAIEVDNAGDTDVFVRSVRLDSRVAGLTFFTFSTRVDLELGPGQSGERRFTLDLGDLGGQATGLLPGRVSLLGEDRAVLASQSVAVDVRGSLRSAYGLFGILVALITAILLTTALVRLAAGRLAANRWSRAARFAAPGVGIGLTITFGLSALRVLLPSGSTWVTLIVLGGVGGFVAGYLTPGPDDDDDDDDDDRLYEAESDDELVGAAPATAPAGAAATRAGREPPPRR